MPRRRFWLVCIVLAAGLGVGFWAYWTVYLPRANQTESAILSAEHITGFQTTDKVVLNIRLANPDGKKLRGTLRVQLMDAKGKVLGERDKAINQVETTADYRVEVPAALRAAERVTLQCSFGKQKFTVPLSRVLAVKAHETTLTANQQFIAGTPAAIRCGVHAVQSVWEETPLINADVRISLRSKRGSIYHLHKGKTGKDGWDQVQFTVPAVPAGPYTLQVATKSELGQENLEQVVQVKTEAENRRDVKAASPANHAETGSRSFPGSDQPIWMSLIPEGGRLVPDLENRIFVMAIYPDGRPAPCDLIVRRGKQLRGPIVTTVPTNEVGLAEFRFTPRGTHFRKGPWAPRVQEMLGGERALGQTQRLLYDLVLEARDNKGHTAQGIVTLTGAALGENLLFRLDKAIYRPGETMKLEVLTTPPNQTMPYVDLVRDGQIVLTRSLELNAGRADAKLDLPPNRAGILEVHIYQILDTGALVHDSRVVSVQPDKEVDLPAGGERIRFQISRAAGKPGAANQGAINVGESVYPLQDMPPGLEKGYLTLQDEWLKLQTPMDQRPAPGGPDVLVRALEVTTRQQQIARAMLAAARPRLPRYWVVEPSLERRQKLYHRVRQIGWTIYDYARRGQPFMEYERLTRRWTFRRNLLQEMVAAGALDASLLDGPFGSKLILDDLTRWEPNFTVSRVAELVTWERFQELVTTVGKYTAGKPQFQRHGQWTFPATTLAEAVKAVPRDPRSLNDAWGDPIQLVKRPFKLDTRTGQPQFEFHELVSAGPDRVFDTSDDLKLSDPHLQQRVSEPLFGMTLSDFQAGGWVAPKAP